MHKEDKTIVYHLRLHFRNCTSTSRGEPERVKLVLDAVIGPCVGHICDPFQEKEPRGWKGLAVGSKATEDEGLVAVDRICASATGGSCKAMPDEPGCCCRAP